MKRVGIFGNYGVGNLGDEAVLRILLSEFRSKCASVAVFSGCPVRVRTDHNVDSFSFFPSGIRSVLRLFVSCSARENFRKSLYELRCCEDVVFGGGGLFVDALFEAVVLWWVQLFFCLMLHKKVTLLSQNISISKWYARLAWIPLLERVSLITVRDRTSEKNLLSYGVPSQYLPDFTFLQSPVLRASLSPRFLISLRDYELHVESKKSLSEFFFHLSQAFVLQFLVFQQGVRNDRHLYEELDVPGDIIEGNSVFEAYASASYLLGMRYHSLVFALQARLPFLALSYQPKVDGFVRDIGMKDFLIPVSRISSVLLRQSFDALVDSRQSVVERLDSQAHLMERAAEHYTDFSFFTEYHCCRDLA